MLIYFDLNDFCRMRNLLYQTYVSFTVTGLSLHTVITDHIVSVSLHTVVTMCWKDYAVLQARLPDQEC